MRPTIVFALFSVSAFGASLYVSPSGNDKNNGRSPERAFATIERARDEARTIKKSGEPVTVYLRGGAYRIERPIVFTPADSGSAKAPVTYAAYKAEKPVVSGGRAIRGWKAGEKGVWTTTIDEVKNGKWSFNQIFVNGQFRHRARTPNKGFLRVKGMPDGTPKKGYNSTSQRFEYAPGDINPNWRNLNEVEVIVYHFWNDTHLPIATVDDAAHMVTFQKKVNKVFSDDFTENGARYIVDNVYEGLDEPGEWYLDRATGVLSYIPMPGENMSAVEVIAPVAPGLLSFEGDPLAAKFVEHVRFSGIAFEHTNYALPAGDPNRAQASAAVPAAISARGLRNAAFERCAVRNTGTYAIDLKTGCRNNRIERCELSQLAAGGIRIDGGLETSHPLERTGGNVVADNHVHHYGEIYPSAVGVLLMHTDANQIAHNEIDHGYYTAVSLGWKWGYMRSVSRDNIVEHNHLHHIGQGLLSDMGGIYTLGVSPGTVLRYNRIHDVDANQYGGWGIYHDEGSTHILTEKNLVYNTKYCGFNIHYGKEITVRNNIFAFGRIDQLSMGRVEPHVTVYFENNIVYWKEGVLMAADKADKPYTMWMGPMPKRDAVPFTSTVDSDWNIFFNPNEKPEQAKVGKKTLVDWQARGKDKHSLYQDPMFVDAAKLDFRLKPESPALKLGFEQFDTGTAGPRGPVGPGR